MKKMRTCPECGGRGYYAFDHYGHLVTDVLCACLMCGGYGNVEVDE